MPKIIYIAHQFANDPKGNIKRILNICKEVHSKDILPFTPYMAALHYLNDTIPEERALGMTLSAEFFKRKVIDEVWLCGSTISNGMKEEIKLAKKYNIPIKFHNKELEKVLKVDEIEARKST